MENDSRSEMASGSHSEMVSDSHLETDEGSSRAAVYRLV